MCEGVSGIRRLLSEPGLKNVDFADLAAVTRGRHSESSFATAEAQGENRPQQIVEKLLAHPLIEGGALLNESDSVLVSLLGGPDLTLAEINRVMEQINRQCENADVTFGAAINPEFSGRLAVTLIASRRSNREEIKSQRSLNVPAKENFNETFQVTQSQPADESFNRPVSRFACPAPTLADDRKEKLFTQQTGGSKRKKLSGMRQGQLNLEAQSRGRFEKSEPTIRDGKNLDVPTYVRYGIALN